MIKTFATLFSGGELAGVGIRNASLEHKWGIELKPEIATVANQNGFNVKVANLLDCDPRDFEKVDALHASPPCPNFSQANSNKGEKQLDIDLATKVCEFITVIKPHIFTLENVFGYRNSKSFKLITGTLSKLGYFWDYDNLNSADYSVPQTRRRLILRAVYGRLLPNLPAPEKWVGWYEAIIDLIPTLPDSHFAKWQMERLPEELKNFLVNEKDIQDREPTVRDGETRSFTIQANTKPDRTKAFLQMTSNTNIDQPTGTGVLEPCLLANTVTQASLSSRAFVVNTREMHDSKEVNELTVRDAENPIFGIGATSQPTRYKAFVIDGKPADHEGNLQIVDGDLRQITITASIEKHPIRAFAFDNFNATACVIRTDDEPASVIERQSLKKHPRPAFVGGRVVSMTPRALARFMSLPDWYVLPKNNTLACKILGNGVTCLMIEKIYRGLIA